MFSLYARLQPVIGKVRTDKDDLDLLARLQDCRVMACDKLHQLRLAGYLQEAEGYEPGFNVLIITINKIEDRLSIQPRTSNDPVWRETFGSPI
jgi:hypothetical protein